MRSDKKKGCIYLTGGTGNLGKEMLKLLPEAVPLVRKPSGLKNEKVVDFANKEGLKNELSDCGVLIHLAGCMKFHDNKALCEGNVILTQNLLAAIPAHARVIFASSIAVYGKNLPGIADETTPVNPDSVYAQTKYKAEEMVMARKNSIALRIGPIYGLGYEDYPKFIKLIKNGRMVIFGDGKNNIPFVHAVDVANAIKNALAARPGVYIVAGPGERQEKIYEIVAKKFNVAPPRIKIPLKIALLFAYLLEKISLLSGKKPFISREIVNLLGKNRIFNFSKAQKELGFSPRLLEKGICELIDGLAWEFQKKFMN